MTKDYSFGVVLIRKDGDKHYVLLVREHATSGVVEERGSWGLPKGHADHGESPIETARRELFEETGIKTVSLDENKKWLVNYIVSKNGNSFDKTVTYFQGSTDETVLNPAPGEIAECEWVTLKDAISRVTFDNVKKILDEVMADLAEK